jgi:hypothetical protein
MPFSTNTSGRAVEAAVPGQEAVMGKAVPTQHHAVVLRSHYRQLRALLAIAMTAIVGLSTAVVILATNNDRSTGAGSATQVSAPGSTRHDGGAEEGSRGPFDQPGPLIDDIPSSPPREPGER